ncbi:hypothetical protein I6F37_44595, partial [Bradyrhizobium sp. NBAIM08]|nr:hypothetical protein [Bradyrhizobium sp. NBAIM08]
ITNTGSAAVTHTLSGQQTLTSTSSAGVNFNIIAPTTAGTVGLNITGIMYANNGFTKSGDGILQISAANFTDVEPGFTVPNDLASLFGQIQVNGGILYVGNTRALGAFGVGNETIAASGATIDLRDQ